MMRSKKIIAAQLACLLAIVLCFSSPSPVWAGGGVEDSTTMVIIASSVLIIAFFVLPIIKNAVTDSAGWWVMEGDVEVEKGTGLLTTKNIPCKAYNKPGSTNVVGELNRYSVYKIISTSSKNNITFYEVVETKSIEKEQNTEGMLKMFQGIGFPSAK